MGPTNLPSGIGRYEVVERLGRGGMGVVYKCRDPRIGRSVAVKLLRAADEDTAQRFLQEAQSAGNLKHHNIITIYDYGEHEDQPFIVMEFVQGPTLAEQIRQRTRFSFARKLELVEDLSRALDYAHNQGVIHRDVKPANLMIDRDGVLKVLDFGIARLADSELTQVGVMMGTPNYMSPEQIEGRTVDRRSDMFAVGLVFYELLTYRQAFSGDTAHGVMNSIVRDVPQPLGELCPGIDPDVEAIVARALEKDPSKRYRNLAVMAAEIAGIRAGLQSDASGDDGAATIVMPPPPAPDSGRTPRLATDREMLAKRRTERLESEPVSGPAEAALSAADEDREERRRAFESSVAVQASQRADRGSPSAPGESFPSEAQPIAGFEQVYPAEGVQFAASGTGFAAERFVGSAELAQVAVLDLHTDHVVDSRPETLGAIAEQSGSDWKRSLTQFIRPWSANPMTIGAMTIGITLLIGVILWVRHGPASSSAATQISPATHPPVSLVVEDATKPTVTSTPTAAPPVAVTPSVEPAAAVVNSAANAARAELRRGDLLAAANTVAAGLSSAPADPALKQLSRSVLAAAQTRATQARQAADRAGRSSAAVYGEASRHVQAANRSARTGDSLQAVQEYLTASGLFATAAELPAPAPAPPVETPKIAAAPPAVPIPQPTVVPGNVATPPPALNSVPVTTVNEHASPAAETSVVASKIDVPAAQRLLSAYAAAYRGFNLGALLDVFPNFSQTARQRLDQEKKSHNYCEYRFANYSIVPGSGTTGRVEVDSIQVCKPKTGQRPFELRAHEIFDVSLDARGKWLIVRQATSPM